MSNNKFVSKFIDLTRTTFKNIAVINGDAIFKEQETLATTTTVDKTAYHLIFDILSTICESTTYNLISPYSKADNDDVNDRDGRRAFFALMREFFPKTTISSDSVEGREELQPIGAERATKIRESAATCSRKLFDISLVEMK